MLLDSGKRRTSYTRIGSGSREGKNGKNRKWKSGTQELKKRGIRRREREEGDAVNGYIVGG